MIIATLLIALMIRLISLNQSLWLDEAINVLASREHSFLAIITQFAPGDFHPPLYYLFLKAWISLFGASEISVRIPSVLFGVATIYLTYLIGKKLFSKKTAIIASILMATAPLHIYYSQEARMYSMAAFLTSLSVYFFIKLIKENKNRFWFIALSILMLYTDYLPWLMFLVFNCYVIWKRKQLSKKWKKSWSFSQLIIFAFLLPWLLIFVKQLSTGISVIQNMPLWADVLGRATIKNLALTAVKFTIGRISIDNNLVYALVLFPIFILLLILFIKSFRTIKKEQSIIWFWLFIPIITSFIISFFIPVYSYFRLLFVLPAFYLIITKGAMSFDSKKTKCFLVITILLINLISSAIYLTNPKFQREDWKVAVNFIEKTADNSSIVIFESSGIFDPWKYYHDEISGVSACRKCASIFQQKKNLDAFGILRGSSSKKENIQENIKTEILAKNKTQIFLFQYLSGITDHENLAQKELEKNFTLKEIKDFNGVGFVYIYIKS